MKECNFTEHDNGDIASTIKHVSGVCIKCGADLNKLYKEFKSNQICPECGKKGKFKANHSDEECGYCGYSWPKKGTA